MNFYDLDIKEVFSILKSGKSGLTTNEVNKRLNKYGKNKLIEENKQSNLKKFLTGFNDLMIIILIIAAIISLILSIFNQEPIIDSIIILAIVILNTTLSYIQEQKANKTIEALKKLQVTKIKVKRDNIINIVDSEEIVPGDILILEAGDTIPADARIIWESSLKVDESSLTGESIAIEKTTLSQPTNTPLTERINMIYSGTHIVYGKCQAIVCKTGMNTEFGLIAQSLYEEKKENH